MQDLSNSIAFGNGASLRRRGSIWRWYQLLRDHLAQGGKRRPKSLRLCESLPLGEHRFVAVIAYRDSRFLLGGTPGSLVLLAKLGNESGSETEPGGVSADSSQEQPH